MLHTLFTTLTHLGSKMKGLATAQDMWKVIKDNTTSKSTLYLLDAEDQLFSMKLQDNDGPKTHLSEFKQHFPLMLHKNLIKVGSTLSDTCST